MNEAAKVDDPAVLAQNLDFAYASAFRLRVEHWCVGRGEKAALYGPSGCGKSTLLSLVAGVLVPDSGKLSVEGSDIAAMSDSARRSHRIRRVGSVFQESPLVDYLNALDNVLFPFRLNRDLRLDDAAQKRAEGLLDQLGLGDKRDRRPAELSQGERQRVGIARALVARPTLLLADEPTSGLDPESAERAIDLLMDLSERYGLTLLVVTHDPVVRQRFEIAYDVSTWSSDSTKSQTGGGAA